MPRRIKARLPVLVGDRQTWLYVRGTIPDDADLSAGAVPVSDLAVWTETDDFGAAHLSTPMLTVEEPADA